MLQRYPSTSVTPTRRSELLSSTRVLLLVIVLVSLLFFSLQTCLHAAESVPVEYSLSTIMGGVIGDGLKATSVGMNGPYGLSVDKKNGNVYYTDTANNLVRFVDSNGISHLLAGSPTYQTATSISDDLKFANDSMNLPYSVAVNSKGEVFISSIGRVNKVYYNSTINDYSMVTIAGGVFSPLISIPRCIVVSPKDEVFICDYFSIQKIVNETTLVSYVGNRTSGSSPDGTLAVKAVIKSTAGIAFHPITGELYFTDPLSDVIRYIASNGSLYTFATLTYPGPLVFDSNGDLYVISVTRCQIFKYSKGVRSTIANSAGGCAVTGTGDGGSAVNARFSNPVGLDLYGNKLFVADYSGNRIRVIDLVSGSINTFAGDGSTRYQMLSGVSSLISLWNPKSTFYNSKNDELMIVDGAESVVLRLNSVTNYRNSMVDKIAGTGISVSSADGKLGNLTSLYGASSVVQADNGDIYVGTVNGIKKMSNSSQIISTFAGSVLESSGDGYPAIYARLSSPEGIAVSSTGEIFFSDQSSNVIRKINTKGIISTVAGTQTTGYLDGPALKARFYGPSTLAFTPEGDLIIADYINHRIRKLSFSTGNVTTIAGTGNSTFNGDGLSALSTNIIYLSGLCVNASNGDIFFSEPLNYRIRKIDFLTGKISTVVGTGLVSLAYTPDGFLPTSTNVSPLGLAIHPISGELYFVSYNSKYVVRRIDSKDGKVYTVAGGGNSMVYSSLANATYIGGVSSISFTPNGDLYLNAPSSHVIKKMNYGSNILTNVAGVMSYSSTSPDGPALTTTLTVPQELVYANGELIFIDSGSVGKIRKISSGKVVTLSGGIGDGGLATLAKIGTVSSLALTDTDLYLADQQNNRIRKISLSTGIINTVVGTWNTVDNGDNYANQTNINIPNDIRILNNQLIFTDTGNSKIRLTDISGKGKVITIAGRNTGEIIGSENIPATKAYLNSPGSISYLPNGELIIADTGQAVIRKVDLNGNITSIAGKYSQSGFNGDYPNAKNALLNNPQGLSILKDGRIIFADTNNIRIRMLTPYCPNGYAMAQSSSGLVCNQIVDYCTLYPTSYVCSTPVFNVTETQTTTFSNITELDSKTIQFSSTPTISISLPSTLSQYIQNSIEPLQNDSVQVVSTLSESRTETAVISQVVSLVLLKSNSKEKISIQNLEQPISLSFENITLTIPSIDSLNISCVYFEEDTKEWKSDGLETRIQNKFIAQYLADGNVTIIVSIMCETNHLTSFSVIDQNYKKASQPNKEDGAILQDNTVLIAAIVGGVGGLCVIGVVITLAVIVCIFVARRRKMAK